MAQTLASSLPRVAAYLAANGVQPTSAAPVARYLTYTNEATDFQAGFFVEKALPESGDIKVLNLPKSVVATVVHYGAYEKVGAVYEAIHHFMDELGYEAAGAPWEQYVDDPTTTPQDKVRTIVRYPLQKKGSEMGGMASDQK
jgi:effector-binding domain-containing protein